MIIRSAKFKKCPKCKYTRRISEEKHGCDECKKPIDIDNPERDYLSLDVHYNKASTSKTFHFCSWLCCLNFFRKIQTSSYKSDYFISLPIIHCEDKKDNLGYDYFIEAMMAVAQLKYKQDTNKEFIRGVAYAAAQVIRERELSLGLNILRESNFTMSDLKSAEIDDYDMKSIKEVGFFLKKRRKNDRSKGKQIKPANRSAKRDR